MVSLPFDLELTWWLFLVIPVDLPITHFDEWQHLSVAKALTATRGGAWRFAVGTNAIDQATVRYLRYRVEERLTSHALIARVNEDTLGFLK
jgi:hypothetical protein